MCSNFQKKLLASQLQALDQEIGLLNERVDFYGKTVVDLGKMVAEGQESLAPQWLKR